MKLKSEFYIEKKIHLECLHIINRKQEKIQVKLSFNLKFKSQSEMVCLTRTISADGTGIYSNRVSTELGVFFSFS